MYKGSQDYYDVEPVCYEEPHIAKVSTAIKENFDKYFDSFLSSDSTNAADRAEIFRSIIVDEITEYERDRESYLDLMDLEVLDEYEDDPDAFKSKALANRCPIIRKTLRSDDKKLKKYQIAWCQANAEELRKAVFNLCSFAESYALCPYDDIESWQDLGLDELDEDKYRVYQVIGGGIRTHMLYKKNPEFFPNMSRNAIWALWFLSGQQSFGCVTDSEFIMADDKIGTTQQNYFYPYGLFGYYAYGLYRLLDRDASELGVYIDPKYRYVAVNAFLEHVADRHSLEINELSHDATEDQP